MKQLNLTFSHNWNNKLFCKCFTTLRLWNEKKYQVGNTYAVYLKDEYLGEAEMISIRKTKRAKLNQFVCGLDTGYSVAETQQILGRMYKQNADNDLMFGMLKFVKRAKESSIAKKLNS